MSSQLPGRRPKPRRVAESERRRARRACDGCRRQKEKCEGGVPCDRCTRLRRQCEFHKLSSGPTAPNHERASQGAVDAADLLERSRYMEKLLRHHVPGISFDKSALRALAEQIPDDDERSPTEMEDVVEPYSADHQDSINGEEDLSMDEHFSVQPLPHNATHYSGEFSYWNFSMRIKKWIEDWASYASPGKNQETTGFEEFYRAEHLESSSEVLASIANFPPRHIADFLVTVFFKHADTIYYFVEKSWLDSAIDMVYDDPSSLTSKDCGTMCSILTIFAIGTQYAYLDSPNPNKVPADAAVKSTSSFSEDEVGRKFFSQASRLIPDVITVASLESVQACLLMGFYTLPLDASGLSYNYLNLALKLGIQNGMHRKHNGQDMNDGQIELRNRIWWTVLTIERRVCILHGRPISISSSDVDADKPVYRANQEISSNTPTITNLLTTIRLTEFLEELASQVFVKFPAIHGLTNETRSILRRCPKTAQVENLKILAHIKDKMVHWWKSIVPSIGAPQESFQLDSSRPHRHLNLEYCLSRMYVGRPFMFTRDSGTSPSSDIDMLGRPVSRLSTRAALVEDCVKAALEVVSICRSLKESVGLARASYTEFSSCRAALLVIIAQSLHKRTDDLKIALQEGMGMIRMMSTGGDSARSEVSLMEAFERAISRMDAFAEQVNLETTPSADSAYDRFKDWERLWTNDPNASIGPDQPTQNPRSTSFLSNVHAPLENLAPAFFGLDDSSFSYPQVLEDFSSIPPFEYNFD